MPAGAPAVPQELLDLILDAVADPTTLKQCALVARPFRYRSQKNLFKTLTITPPSSSWLRSPPSITGLNAILAASPDLALHVRSLKLLDSGDSTPSIQGNPNLGMPWHPPGHAWLRQDLASFFGVFRHTLTSLRLVCVVFETGDELLQLIRERPALRVLCLDAVTIGNREAIPPAAPLHLRSLTLDPSPEPMLKYIVGLVEPSALRHLHLGFCDPSFEPFAQSRLLDHAENLEELQLDVWHDSANNTTLHLNQLRHLHTLKIALCFMLAEQLPGYAPWTWANDVLSSTMGPGVSPPSLRHLILDISVDETDLQMGAIAHLSALNSTLGAWQKAISPTIPAVKIRLNSYQVDFSVNGAGADEEVLRAVSVDGHAVAPLARLPTKMGALHKYIMLLLAHPLELATIVKYKVFHERSRNLKTDPTSGWERETMRACWVLLELTSRSYVAVIKELDGDLARTICLFYLVLRGLDTIEDDMTLPQTLKQSLLRSFHIHTITPGWRFTDSGPDEHDRELLVQYPAVVTELLLLPPESRAAIVDIAAKMGAGMADFCLRPPGSTLDTHDEYELYCHYVAGLVGEGLSLLFAASGKERADLAGQLVLSNSFGAFLQKTNITRDLWEDAQEGRSFYPRPFWEEYGFAHPGEMCPASGRAGDVQKKAMWVQTAMVADALRHATDALEYLHMLRDPSVFRFCAIPATMAMATLALCFMNPEVFVRHVKIRKGVAVDLIMRSTQSREVALLFRDFARKIHARALPEDPSFMKLSVACGKIEQWCERVHPTNEIPLSTSEEDCGGAQIRSTVAGHPHLKLLPLWLSLLFLAGAVVYRLV
ncbi:hypothetical protein MKEN_01167500 [Mycena kentingensis (nom. inval.)]|nr:hypothetical protein MKEN_01167500 [Mycena kentingensis (nom. inval.)]